MSKEKPACPKHDCWLLASDTQYGKRWDCPEPGCDVMMWGGKTSTPADQETRNARKEAHGAFDSLWRGSKRRRARSNAYKALAVHMKLPAEECHIGMFDIKQCRKVKAWAKRVLDERQQQILLEKI